MSTVDETVVELSRKKILLLIFGSLAFVAIGGWLLSLDETAIQSRHRSPELVHGVGIVATALFGLTGVFGIKKLFDRKPGLTFNSAGIFDNSSGVAAGLIPWSEVVGAEVFEVHKQKMLIIKVRNPEKYIGRGGALRQMLNRASYKMCGSPIAINSSTLKINFTELLSLFDKYRQKYGNA